jgi:uncharacterized RDD family membrane protein YckC/Tfp pilus assembly major pilin PilA
MSLLNPVPAAAPLYAGFWRRVAAAVLDGLILFAANLLVGLALGGRQLLVFVVGVAIACAYYAGMHSSSSQATLGKMAFGVKVTDLEGERISLGRGIGRYFATWLSAIILMIGYLMAAFTEERQALHDKIAGTLVVNKDAAPEDMAAGGAVMPLTAGVWVTIVLLFILPFFGGILAAIAIPAYNDYTVRAQVADVIASANVLRTQVHQTIAQKQPMTAGPLPISSKYAQSAMVSPEGVIVVTLVANVAKGGRIVLTPSLDSSGNVLWKCSGLEMPPKFLPVSCRN